MPMEKVCPRCGVTFDCNYHEIVKCQCATIKLDPLQRTYLEENYPSCLCHDCLAAVKQSFYACEINPLLKLKKGVSSERNNNHDDKESSNCQ